MSDDLRPRCERCGVSVGVTALHRTGSRGRGCDPLWRCGACVGHAIDPTILAITDAVQLGVDPRTLHNVTAVDLSGGQER